MIALLSKERLEAEYAKPVPDAWRDPSGWRPSPEQMTVPPFAKGIPINEWQRKQPLWTEAERLRWIALYSKR